jgi:hypothetical protein
MITTPAIIDDLSQEFPLAAIGTRRQISAAEKLASCSSRMAVIYSSVNCNVLIIELPLRL